MFCDLNFFIPCIFFDGDYRVNHATQMFFEFFAPFQLDLQHSETEHKGWAQLVGSNSVLLDLAHMRLPENPLSLPRVLW